MWKIYFIFVIQCFIVKAAPPHHLLAESSDPEVQKFGELVNELVKIFEEGWYQNLMFHKVIDSFFYLKVIARKNCNNSAEVKMEPQEMAEKETKESLASIQAHNFGHIFKHKQPVSVQNK